MGVPRGCCGHMEKISDTITTVFHIAIKDKRPAVCLSGDGAIVWSDTFGLGWRFGISCNPHEWFAKVRLYLDHNHSHTEQDQAIVTVCLRDTADTDAKGLKERVTTIIDFGHGQPALLGSWSSLDLVLLPYVSLTLVTKARLTQLVADPLASTSLALRQSMESGDFVDTKFYVFSTKRPGTTAGKPRVVYANNNSIGLVLPKSTLATKQLAPAPFLVNMTGDHHVNGDSVLHEYEYEQDSDLDDEEEDGPDSIGPQHNTAPRRSQATSSSKSRKSTGSTRGSIHGTEDELQAGPPAYSVSSCRMMLVKGVAYKTWLSYIYFRYTGQVSFLPLKSAHGSSKERPNDPNKPPRCSPKSMYRLAAKLGDERMKELAFRAIREGLSKDNIVEEALSWFTAQYPIITEYEVDRVSEHRKSPEVSSAIKLQLKTVSLGEKPWAYGALIAIMEKLNPSEQST
ncbi:hypothetical protein J3R82DRAFT_10747 [Butyriboletus roseoflavus]|nr:hypothetical protein J3R82DRAFT_10747 [Butyriboletus roseoflavus]